jgi:hypothetical protein
MWATRSQAVAFSEATCARLWVVTQTRSEGRAARQTKPLLHVLGPEAPLPALVNAAFAFSWRTWVCRAGVTHTTSPSKAPRQTKPCRQEAGP